MVDGRDIDQQAADWLLLLGEEPDDPGLRDSFDQWLKANPRHRDAWKRISEAGAVLAQAPAAAWDRVTVPPLSVAGPKRRRHAGGAWQRQGRLRRGAIAALAVAASVAVVAAPSVRLLWSADYRSGAAEIQTIALASGGTVRLGPESAIAIDQEADRAAVQLLSGRAWFDITHGPSRPFTVTADGVTATASGSGFDMRRTAGGVRVSVGHGRVDVTSDGVARRVVEAGQWVEMESDAHRSRQEAGREPSILFSAWQQRRLPIRDRSIADAIDELRPWYPGRIILLDGELGQRRITGFFDVSDPAMAIRNMVEPQGGHIIRVTPWVILVSGA